MGGPRDRGISPSGLAAFSSYQISTDLEAIYTPAIGKGSLQIIATATAVQEPNAFAFVGALFCAGIALNPLCYTRDDVTPTRADFVGPA
jgi:hypothetical protein